MASRLVGILTGKMSNSKKEIKEGRKTEGNKRATNGKGNTEKKT